MDPGIKRTIQALAIGAMLLALPTAGFAGGVTGPAFYVEGVLFRTVGTPTDLSNTGAPGHPSSPSFVRITWEGGGLIEPPLPTQSQVFSPVRALRYPVVAHRWQGFVKRETEPI